MASTSALRPWWRSPGPLFGLLLHAVLFLGCFQLRFPPGEWERMEAQLPPSPSTAQWFHHLTREHGLSGVVIWFFDTHQEIALYHRYAQIAVRGIDPQTPADAPGQGVLRLYRDVPMEYQPGALLMFVPPALVARELQVYETAFTLWCGLVYVTTLWLALHVLANGAPVTAWSAQRAFGWSFLFLLCFGGVAAARFDSIVPLFCAAAAWSFQRADRRDSTSGFAATGAIIAAGVLTKIVPGVALPAALLWLWGSRPHHRWRPAVALLAGFVLSLALLHLGFYLRWGEGYLASYTYHLERGLQIESVAAGLLMLVKGLGQPLAIVHQFGAWELFTPLAQPAVALGPLAFLSLAGLVAFRYLKPAPDAHPRDRGQSVLLLSVVLLLAFMLTNKVFSPQYLLWLAPLFAALYGTQPALKFAAAALLLAAALSQAVFPHLYSRLQQFDLLPVALLNLRNATLLVILGWLLWRLNRVTDAHAAPSAGVRRARQANTPTTSPT